MRIGSEIRDHRTSQKYGWSGLLLILLFIPFPGVSVLNNLLFILIAFANAVILFSFLGCLVKSKAARIAASAVLACYLYLTFMLRLDSSSVRETLLLNHPGLLPGLQAGIMAVGFAGSLGIFAYRNRRKTGDSFSNSLKDHPALTTFLLTLSCWLSQSFHKLYMGVDNPLLSQIANGCYGSDNVSEFISPILSWIVRGFNLLMPSADGLILYYSLIIFSGTWMLFYSIQKIWRKPSLVFLAYFLFIALNADYNLFHANFTRITAWCLLCSRVAMTACILKKGNRNLLLSAGLEFLAGCLIRLEACYLCIPFMILDAVYLMISEKKKAANKIILSALIAVSSIGIAFGSSWIYSRINNTREALRYSDARSSIVDYETMDYQEKEQELLAAGISENDLRLLKKLFLADTAYLDADRLAETADIIELNLNLGSIRKNMEAQKVSEKASAIYPAVIFSVLIILITGEKKLVALLFVLCSAAGSILIYMFFGALSRLPDRLCFAIEMALYGSLLLDLAAVSRSGKCPRLLSGTGWMNCLNVLVFGLCSVFLTMIPLRKCFTEEVKLMQVFRARTHLAEETEVQITGPRYLWDVTILDVWMDTHFWYQGYLPDRTTLIENLPDGEWVYGQNYFNNLLAAGGWGNPIDRLITGEAGFVTVEKNLDVLEQIRIYILEHYQITGEFVQTDWIDNKYQVWSFKAEISGQLQ